MRRGILRQVILVVFAALLSVGSAGCKKKAQEESKQARATGGTESSPSVAAVWPPAGPPSQPGPLEGSLEAGKPYMVQASGRNSNVQLTVTDLEIVNGAGGSAAPPGMQYVVLSTAWKNLVEPKQVERPKSKGRSAVVGGGETETVMAETPYMVPALPDNLYLLLDGRHVAEISGATENLADHLPLSGLILERYNAEVRGKVAFAVPVGTIQSLTLQFFDFTQGHINLPLYGTAPTSAGKPLAAPQRNQFFEVAIYRTEFTKKLGQNEAPAGNQYLVVEFGASSTATGAATQLDFDQYAFLIQDGVYQSQPVKDLAGVPYFLHGLVRFIPEFVRRGVTVFLVPEQAGRLELLLSASQMDPLSFLLTPDRQAKPQPQPAGTIQDGDTAEILLNSWTWMDRLGDSTPARGRRYLVLDVTVSNKEPRQGLTVQPMQFLLTSGRTEFEPSRATEKLPHPLTGERNVPAGTRARFEVAFEAPRDAQGLRLKYQGFTKIEEVPVP